MSEYQTYNGNSLVKGDGVKYKYSLEELKEYKKCRDDIVYFCNKYVKVINLDEGLVNFELRPYQVDMINHIDEHRFTILKLGRQVGKSVVSCAYLLHYIIFNTEKKVGILANKAATSREMLSRIVLMLENLPFFLQPGCKILNKGNVLFSNNSEIIAASTSSSSIRGLSMNCVVGATKVCIANKAGELWYKNISDVLNAEVKILKKKKKFEILVKTTNKITEEVFYAAHSTNNKDDGFLGFGLDLERDIEIYGPDALIVEHLPNVFPMFKERKNISQRRVLTEKGFRTFRRLADNGIPASLLEISYGFNSVKCTPDHEFMLADGTFVEACNINLSDTLYPDIPVTGIKSVKPERVYDLVDVDDTHSYLTNGVISHNCIFMDEFAFVQNSEEFYTSTYPVISSGSKSKVIITSTPNGMGNMFYKLWDAAENSNSNYKPFKINWWDVPGRDEKWKAETIANTSPEQFRQEYECLGGDSEVTVIINNKETTIKLRNLYETYPLLYN